MAIDVKELMAKVGKIKILTNHLIDDQLSGNYHSSFKGQGVEFDEVRPYLVGDDVRSIDWNVTARTGNPYIKRYSEERELTVLFLVDISGSQVYGSVARSKAELAAEITALLALTALRNQDKVGLVLFSDKVEKYLPPRKGSGSVMRLVREVLAAEESAQGKTDIGEAIKFLNGIQKRRAVVFLVSDFLSGGDYSKLLSSFSHHHDLIALSISDPAEKELVDVGLVEMEDPETGIVELVDTSDKAVREAFAEVARREKEELRTLFRRNGIDYLEFDTATPYIDEIRRFFCRRAIKR